MASQIWDMIFGSAIAANLVLASPNGSSGASTFRSLVAADLPAGTGTVTSFSAGTLSPLFTTSVANPTTTPALSFSLSNAAGGTVFGNNTTGAAAPAYTIAPVLGIPGTSTGSLAIASATASGKFTLTAPASAATPTLTLPTTSNVLAGQYAGDGVIFNSTLAVASAAGTLTPVLLTQTANKVLAGPTSGGAATPTFRSLVTADMPAGTGTVTSVAETFTGGLISVAGSPITTSGTFALTVAGTSGGIPYFDSNTSWNTSALLTLNSPVLGGGAGAAPSTKTFLTTDGAATLTVGIAGGGNGVLALSGNTSGTATFTAPATAGTRTNAVVATNGLQLPDGTALLPSLIFSGSSGATGGLFSSGANQVGVSLPQNGIFTVYAAGTRSFYFQPSSNAGFSLVNSVTGTPINIQGAVTTQVLATASAIVMGNNASFTGTSGTQSGILLGDPNNSGEFLKFAPTSGTANFQAVSINTIINQTSTSSGNYTALIVNAVETSLKGTANLLLDLQAGTTGGTSKFAVNNSGITTKYSGITTVSQGMPAEYATVDLTTQSAAITATTLYAVPAGGQGMYRISWCAAVTTVDAVSSVLGGTSGFQITYTDPADSVVKTSPRTVTAGVDTDSTNTTATAISGTIIVFAKLSTNINYQMGYTSTTPGQMVYNLHIKCEAL